MASAKTRGRLADRRRGALAARARGGPLGGRRGPRRRPRPPLTESTPGGVVAFCVRLRGPRRATGPDGDEGCAMHRVYVAWDAEEAKRFLRVLESHGIRGKVIEDREFPSRG